MSDPHVPDPCLGTTWIWHVCSWWAAPPSQDGVTAPPSGAKKPQSGGVTTQKQYMAILSAEGSSAACAIPWPFHFEGIEDIGGHRWDRLTESLRRRCWITCQPCLSQLIPGLMRARSPGRFGSYLRTPWTSSQPQGF